MSNLRNILIWLILPIAASAAEQPVVFVSILPQTWFVQKIAGDAVRVEVLVGPGDSPATFDPPARRLRQLAEADALLCIGVPMENGLLPGLGKSMPQLKIIPIQAGITLRPNDGGDHDSQDGHDHGLMDTHIWLSPVLAGQIARNTYQALLEIVPADSLAMQDNLSALLLELTQLDTDLQAILAPARGATMAVFHPAYGYLAEDYDLHQVAIESEGASPSPRGLVQTLRRLTADGVTTIFVQPQFSDQQALKIAEELDLDVVRLDPLAADYAANMRLIATRISGACSSGGHREQ